MLIVTIYLVPTYSKYVLLLTKMSCRAEPAAITIGLADVTNEVASLRTRRLCTTEHEKRIPILTNLSLALVASLGHSLGHKSKIRYSSSPRLLIRSGAINR